MKFSQNKKGAGDGFAWFTATIVIFFVIIIFLGVYSFAGLSKKVDVSVSSDMSEAYFDNLFRQRISGYFINYGIEGPYKGNFSYYIYNKDWSSLDSFLSKFNRERVAYSNINFFGLSFESRYGRFCPYENLNGDYYTGQTLTGRLFPNYIFESPIYFFIDNENKNERIWFLHQSNIFEVDCK